MKTANFSTIDEYISQLPESVQALMQQVRNTIREAAPDAQETIKYGMPTFTYHGNLVYFAAFKNHIGFYATPTGHDAFKDELAGYKQGKGSVQFPLDKPLPLDLIRRIVQFRVQQNRERNATLKGRKKGG